MTQEDKELLFKELCGRLPYGVKVQCEDYHINHFDYRGLIPKGLAIDATNLNIY